MRLAAACCATLVCAAARASADPDAAAAQLVQMEELRAEVAGQIQLQAFDLLDELVFEWMQHPVFATPTAVILADLTVPVGLGTALQALLENHLTTLLVRNAGTHVVLAFCPQCTATVVHSGPQGTVVSRGVDAPGAIAEVAGDTGARHALFVDFEAEGASLVLRARVTVLEPTLPIVYARTLSSAGSAAALLREPERLKSAADARREYVEALEGRGLLLIPFRVAVRSYAMPEFSDVGSAPFVWFQAGAEVALTQARAWTAETSVGFSWSPETHDGWLMQTRLARLISGRARSLTAPDLYLFLGGSVISIHGLDAAVFSNETPDLTNLALAAIGKNPRKNFAAWNIGLELRVKNRISVAAFLETMPTLDDAPAIGKYLDLGIIEFQTIGAEVGVCF